MFVQGSLRDPKDIEALDRDDTCIDVFTVQTMPNICMLYCNLAGNKSRAEHREKSLRAVIFTQCNITLSDLNQGIPMCI